MKKLLATLIPLILLGCSNQQPHNGESSSPKKQELSMEEYCSNNPCRHNRRVQFLTDGEPIDQVLELYWPVVLGEKISLLPGDEVYVEAEIIDGIVTNLKSVSKVIDESKTITFNFSQMDGKQDMILSVKNPFKKAIKFHLDMIDYQGNPHQTSSCPVIAGGGLYEHWPHAIPELIVSNIRSVELSDSAQCVY